MVKGRVLTEQTAPEIAVDDWPVVRFTPSGAQVGGSLAIVALGLGLTLALGRLSSQDVDEPHRA